MLPPVGGVSEVRVIQPMRALGTVPAVLAIITQDAELPKFEDDTMKFFIFHRPLLAGEDGLVPVRQLLSLGFVVICEFDDHPDYIPVLQRDDIQNFRAVHAVQTSTVPLAEVLVERNPEIAVFPNAIDRLEPPRNFANPDRMTMFFGGLNRESDWPEWIDALNEVLSIAGERLHVHVVNDAGFFEALATEHKSFTPLCDYETYLSLLASSEISFMPLQDNIFNRCKSDLKFLEAAAARVVALATPTVYGRVIEDGRTGMIFHSPDELKQKLLFLLQNHEAAAAMANQARHYVAQHRMLANQVAARLDWYRGLWERRDQLNRELLARVPELLAPPAPVGASKALAEAMADMASPEAMGRVVVVSRAPRSAEP
jgi:glycosyltransferase involved in cell wall biosynthesis